MYRLIVHPSAEGWDRGGKRGLPPEVIRQAQRVLDKLRASEQPALTPGVKVIRHALKHVKTHRVGSDYRLLFDVQGDAIVLLGVEHRRKSYTMTCNMDYERRV